MINSSITNSSNTTKIKNINVRYIIKTYKKILPNLEIEKYFDGLSNIEIYECDDTGYKFFTHKIFMVIKNFIMLLENFLSITLIGNLNMNQH